MLRRRHLWLLSAAACLRVDDAGVLVLVAIDAEQLPVGTVGRVVVVVAVAVMDREFAQPLTRELSRAAYANVRKNLERRAAVVHS